MNKLNYIEEKIAEDIVEYCDCYNADNEEFCTSIEVEDVNIEIHGRIWTDAYCEDNYYNGTGAVIFTNAEVVIDEVIAYDKNDNEIDINIDENNVENHLKNMLDIY